MSKNKKTRSDIDSLKRLIREERLEQEKQFGRKHSKTWDTKPDAHKDRRISRQKLRNYNDYLGDSDGI